MAQTLVAADSGVINASALSSMDNWRAFVHQAAPVIVTALVAVNLTDNATAAAWLPFAFAIADNLLATGGATDRIRRAIYAGVGVLQTGGLVSVLLEPAGHQWVLVGSAVLSIASAFLARFYSPTSTIIPTETLASGRHERPE